MAEKNALSRNIRTSWSFISVLNRPEKSTRHSCWLLFEDASTKHCAHSTRRLPGHHPGPFEVHQGHVTAHSSFLGES